MHFKDALHKEAYTHFKKFFPSFQRQIERKHVGITEKSELKPEHINHR